MCTKAWTHSKPSAHLISADLRSVYNFSHANFQTSAPPRPLRAGVVCFVFGCGHGVFFGGAQSHRDGVYQWRHAENRGFGWQRQRSRQPRANGLRLMCPHGFATCAMHGATCSSFSSRPCPAACCSGAYRVDHRAAAAVSRPARLTLIDCCSRHESFGLTGRERVHEFRELSPLPRPHLAG